MCYPVHLYNFICMKYLYVYLHETILQPFTKYYKFRRSWSNLLRYCIGLKFVEFNIIWNELATMIFRLSFTRRASMYINFFPCFSLLVFFLDCFIFSAFRLIVPAVMSDRKPAVVHLFRNYTAPYDEHFLLRDTRFARPKKPEGKQI